MSKNGFQLENDTIIINRELSELDIFVKDFVQVLKKHSDYLIVSGYVSISTGRTRGTEDVDIIVPIMDKESFNSLFEDLEKNNFWCYQGENPNEIYNFYIKDLVSIRFSRKDEMFPNIEVVPFDQTKKAKVFEFNNPQKIKIKDFEFKIPPVEFEILYKEIILSTKKDFEDANHIRAFFSKLLKEERFEEYGNIIKAELK